MCRFSLKNMDKRPALFMAKRMAELGFKIMATEGTARFFRSQGIGAAVVGIERPIEKGLTVKTIQEFHEEVEGRPALR